MSALMHDAVSLLSPAARLAHTRGSLTDIAYADDTLLIGACPQHVGEFLAAVSTAGKRYGMSLHYGKFHLVQVQCEGGLSLPGGGHLAPEAGMNYLGTILAEGGRISSELSRRIGIAKAELETLSKVWRHSYLTFKQKFKFYRSLVESKLLYSLSAACLTVADKRRLDGFQAKCLRQLLRIKPPYYSRVSNLEVLRRSGHKAASKLLLERQLIYLGKVLRSSENSILRSSCMAPGGIEPATSRYIRRVGRPRKEWVPTVMEAAIQLAGGRQRLQQLADDPVTWGRMVKQAQL